MFCFLWGSGPPTPVWSGHPLPQGLIHKSQNQRSVNALGPGQVPPEAAFTFFWIVVQSVAGPKFWLNTALWPATQAHRWPFLRAGVTTIICPRSRRGISWTFGIPRQLQAGGLVAFPPPACAAGCFGWYGSQGGTVCLAIGSAQGKEMSFPINYFTIRISHKFLIFEHMQFCWWLLWSIAGSFQSNSGPKRTTGVSAERVVFLSIFSLEKENWVLDGSSQEKVFQGDVWELQGSTEKKSKMMSKRKCKTAENINPPGRG